MNISETAVSTAVMAIFNGDPTKFEPISCGELNFRQRNTIYSHDIGHGAVLSLVSAVKWIEFRAEILSTHTSASCQMVV